MGLGEDSEGGLNPEESSLRKRISVFSRSEGSFLKKVPLKVFVVVLKTSLHGVPLRLDCPQLRGGGPHSSAILRLRLLAMIGRGEHGQPQDLEAMVIPKLEV